MPQTLLYHGKSVLWDRGQMGDDRWGVVRAALETQGRAGVGDGVRTLDPWWLRGFWAGVLENTSFLSLDFSHKSK